MSTFSTMQAPEIKIIKKKETEVFGFPIFIRACTDEFQANKMLTITFQVYIENPEKYKDFIEKNKKMFVVSYLTKKYYTNECLEFSYTKKMEKVNAENIIQIFSEIKKIIKKLHYYIKNTENIENIIFEVEF